MANIKRFKSKNIKRIVFKTPRFLAERAFLIFWILLLLFISLSTLVFYKYSYLVKKADIEPPKDSILFKEESYNAVLKIWQDKEKRFSEVDLKQYINPF